MNLSHLSYFAVFLIISLESIGIPLPGETTLITASVFAGTSKTLDIFLVILFSTLGAIIGDNIGYLLGRKGGYFFLKKYGKYIHVDKNKLKMGHYLFEKYGGRTVFFGRFFSLLRMFAAFLAGTNNMPWKKFLFFNASGALVWSLFYGYLGFTLGKHISSLDLPLQIISIGIGLVILISVSIFLKKNEKRLEEEAIKAIPGRLENYMKKSRLGK